MWDSLVTLLFDGVASAALGLAIVYAVVRATLAPLERLNAGLAALGRHDYDARLPERAAPEFAPLLARFNALGQSLHDAEHENRRLRARLVSIQDEERKEIGRELHDEIGPHLFAARAQAGAARRAAPGETAALDAVIETIDALQRPTAASSTACAPPRWRNSASPRRCNPWAASSSATAPISASPSTPSRRRRCRRASRRRSTASRRRR